MQETLDFLTSSLEDNIITNSEKKALKEVINSKNPSKRELDWLRSQIFDIAKARIKGFDNQQILEWLEKANKLLLPRFSDNTTDKVYFSPGNDCLNAINSHIGQSTKKIDICVFTISDDRIRDKILFAHKRGVKIRIITDNDKSFDRGSDIHSFSDAGIPVKIDTTEHHMHNKFAIFDSKSVITGSYNWTRSAAAYNCENIIVLNDKSVVEKYEKEFEKLFDNSLKYS
jgi:phosphatidylserine/phosphatidylglycerophosphate/cardiolipin synthase-like enzyme